MCSLKTTCLIENFKTIRHFEYRTRSGIMMIVRSSERIFALLLNSQVILKNWKIEMGNNVHNIILKCDCLFHLE